MLPAGGRWRNHFGKLHPVRLWVWRSQARFGASLRLLSRGSLLLVASPYTFERPPVLVACSFMTNSPSMGQQQLETLANEVLGLEDRMVRCPSTKDLPPSKEPRILSQGAAAFLQLCKDCHGYQRSFWRTSSAFQHCQLSLKASGWWGQNKLPQEPHPSLELTFYLHSEFKTSSSITSERNAEGRLNVLNIWQAELNRIGWCACSLAIRHTTLIFHSVYRHKDKSVKSHRRQQGSGQQTQSRVKPQWDSYWVFLQLTQVSIVRTSQNHTPNHRMLGNDKISQKNYCSFKFIFFYFTASKPLKINMKLLLEHWWFLFLGRFLS